MPDTHSTLKWSLLSGAVYFFLVAVAHFFAFKAPLLYIYYDLPSEVYQDKIIAFTTFGWAMFFVAGYSSVKRASLRSVRYIVIAGAGAVVGLCLINLFTDFYQLSANAQPFFYWVQTAVLSVYLAWVAVFYILAKQEQ
jgi:uncharacterized protein YacL